MAPATPVLSLRRAPGLLARTVADTRLSMQLDAVLADPAFAGARSASCLTVELGDSTLYEARPDATLIPASTMKVLTGMAAVRRLGGDTRLTTHLVTAAPPAAGVIAGPVWFVGAGDPLLATGDYAASFRNQPQVYTPLETLADAVVAAGIREIRGGVVGDDSRFDRVRYHPAWKPTYASDNETGPVSALVVNDGFAQFRPRRTIASADPARHAAEVLTFLLRARGVAVGEPATGQAPPGTTAVASVASPPVTAIVGQMLRESDNLTAEMLVKELGARFGGGGTWERGTDVIRATIEEIGLPLDGFEAVDGSGLDRTDRLSCRILMEALDAAGPGSPLAAGFAVAGETGTLAQRFHANPAKGCLRAKTGSLNYVVGLVGYVACGTGDPLEFALLANELPDRVDSGRVLQERVGAVLARYPDVPPAEQLGPQG